MNNKREALAKYAHDAWSDWMKYLFNKSTRISFAAGDTTMDGVLIPGEFSDRWHRQMNTPYSELPEHEKESDRAEADRIINLLETTALEDITNAVYYEDSSVVMEYNPKNRILTLRTNELPQMDVFLEIELPPNIEIVAKEQNDN